MDKYTYLLILNALNSAVNSQVTSTMTSPPPPLNHHPAPTFDPIKKENAKMTELELESEEI